MPSERFDLGDVTLSCAVHGDGPLVLCAHGFPDDATTFRHQVPALVAAGFRVACPTMRGYAPSDLARSGRYDVEALAGDLLALADRLSPTAPVRLVGHDWGAIAAFAAAARSPRRVSHLVTLSVPHIAAVLRNYGLAQARCSWYAGLFQIPWLAEARLAEGDFALVDRLWRDWSPGYHASTAELRAVKDGLSGRISAVLAYYRSLRSPRALFGPSRELLLDRVRVPALHLHGADDGCILVSSAEGAERLYDGPYRLQVLQGAGHFLQREKPEEVSAALLAFLS